MYRIRSGSGAEAVYNSLEEFNAAVRRGAVAPEDEIFHMRANRWLDVKSHPHYRLAISNTGHAEPAGVAASVAQRPAAPAPKPMPSSPSAPPASSQSTPSTDRPQQTVLRPQLMPQPAPVAPPGPPRKSKELAFIDLGGPAPSSQRNATVIEARRPPAPAAPQASAPPKVEPKSAPPTSEVEFLVMDNGIESPVRTSQGLRTIPEDLDLLFDAPMPKAKPASTPPVVAAPAQQKPQVQAAPSVPATKVDRNAVEVTPREAPKAEGRKVEPPKVEAPRAEAAKVEAPHSGAAKAEAPKVVSPGASAPRVEAPKQETTNPGKPKPVIPPAAPATAVASPAPAPIVSAPAAPRVAIAPKPAVEEDLSIPGPALLESPVTQLEERPAAAPSAAEGRSMGMLVGAAAAVLVVVVGLLAWKPWSSRAAAPSTDQPAAPATTLKAPPVTTVPAITTAPATPKGSAASEPSKLATAAVTPPLRSAEVTPKTDSAVKRQDDEVIAAARPNFRADMDVPSSDLGLGTDIRTTTTATEVVAPTELTRRLETAEKLAQLELGTKLGGFRALFTPSRLSTTQGVNSARTAWSNGADVLRQYRANIARMEKAYEDSVLTSQRAQRWSSEEMRAWAGHQSQAEPVETSQLIDLMFSQVGEGLDLFAALDGQYEIKGGVIVFKNPASGTRYTSIRTWVDQRMQVWAGTPESARPYAVSAVLRALGDGLPPSQ